MPFIEVRYNRKKPAGTVHGGLHDIRHQQFFLAEQEETDFDGPLQLRPGCQEFFQLPDEDIACLPILFRRSVRTAIAQAE